MDASRYCCKCNRTTHQQEVDGKRICGACGAVVEIPQLHFTLNEAPTMLCDSRTWMDVDEEG